MLTKEKEDFLKSVYYNPSSPASFYGIQKLYDFSREQSNLDISKKDIKQWLSNQTIYTQNRHIIRKFDRQKVIAPFIDYQYDADVAYMDSFPNQNKSYKFFLLIIDLMSRFVWTVPLRRLKSNELVNAFKTVFEKGRKPMKLRTDKGVEFVNKQVKSYLKKQNIDHFVTQNEVKANYAERAIKTIRGRLTKYLKKNKTKVWLNELQNITDSYNATKHTATHKAPKDTNANNEFEIWQLNYGPKSETYYQSQIKNVLNKHKVKYNFKIGDVVKISNLRGAFDKEYQNRWTTETFRIIDRKVKQGIDIYFLKDQLNESIEGSFYSNELQKVVVNEDEEYEIEKIIRKRKRSKTNEVLVKWRGFPSKFNSWIPETNVNKYTD